VKGFCAVIPAYNEQRLIASVVEGAARRVERVFAVDDGSTDGTAAAAEGAGATVIAHQRNMGKGAALSTGLARAVEEGFRGAVTLDGDGQHDPSEIPGLVGEFESSGADIVVGTRMANAAGMPFIRLATNAVTSLIVTLTAGQRITDSQSGFRVFRCATAARLPVVSSRFDAETEILIRAARAGMKIREVPVSTIYGPEKSKINPLLDTCRFLSLILRMLFVERPHGRGRHDCRNRG